MNRNLSLIVVIAMILVVAIIGCAGKENQQSKSSTVSVPPDTTTDVVIVSDTIMVGAWGKNANLEQAKEIAELKAKARLMEAINGIKIKQSDGNITSQSEGFIGGWTSKITYVRKNPDGSFSAFAKIKKALKH